MCYRYYYIILYSFIYIKKVLYILYYIVLIVLCVLVVPERTLQDRYAASLQDPQLQEPHFL